ncbi:MAG: hypothetical protein PHG66_01025 [Candidatus Colwellbacteria bacterium]|nr:hypothetical protein [Candidatus Colwellbacteria bacterium]
MANAIPRQDSYSFLDTINPSVFRHLTKNVVDLRVWNTSFPLTIMSHNKRRECRYGKECKKKDKCIFRHDPNYCLNFFLYEKCDCINKNNGYHITEKMFTIVASNTLESLIQIKQTRLEEKVKKDEIERQRQLRDAEIQRKMYEEQMKKWEQEYERQRKKDEKRQEELDRKRKEKQRAELKKQDDERKIKIKNITEPDYVDLSDPSEFYDEFPFTEKYIVNMIVDYMKSNVTLPNFLNTCGCESVGYASAGYNSYSVKYTTFTRMFGNTYKNICTVCFKDLVILHVDYFASQIEFPFGGWFLNEIQQLSHKDKKGYEIYKTQWTDLLELTDLIRRRRKEIKET